MSLQLVAGARVTIWACVAAAWCSCLRKWLLFSPVAVGDNVSSWPVVSWGEPLTIFLPCRRSCRKYDGDPLATSSAVVDAQGSRDPADTSFDRSSSSSFSGTMLRGACAVSSECRGMRGDDHTEEVRRLREEDKQTRQHGIETVGPFGFGA